MYVTYIHTTKHLYTAYTYIWRIWRTNIAISNINCCDLLRIYCIIPHESSYINKCFGADFLSLEFLRVKSTNLFGIPQNLEHFIYSWFGTSMVLPTSALVHQHPPKQPEHFPNNTWWNLTSTLWPTNGALLIHHHVKIGQLRFIKPLILCLPTAQQLKRITFPPTKTSTRREDWIFQVYWTSIFFRFHVRILGL